MAQPMSSKKPQKHSLASLLIQDRFSATTVPKKFIERNSVTEYTGLAKLDERISNSNKNVSSTKLPTQDDLIITKYSQLLDSLSYNYSIPPRVPFSAVESGEFKTVERAAFNHWKSCKGEGIFERNLEIWRQFWIACERADTIIQIVDSRNPEMYFNFDIFQVYPHKKHIIFCNKVDIGSGAEALHRIGIPVVEYSAKNSDFAYPLSGTLCLVGYPNVGKSSTINMILQKKKVRVSATPGKTRSIQTIETPTFTLLDCPGLVFPKHSKINLVLMGVLNVDHIPDLRKYSDEIVKYIGETDIEMTYKITRRTENILEDMSETKSWTKAECLKNIVKDYVSGLIKGSCQQH